MFDFWDKELTEEETEALLDKAAYEIRRRKLNGPAVLALELNKPLSNVGAHAALAFAPFLVPMFGFNFVNDYSRLLSKRDNIERLLQKLEEPPPSGAPTQEDSCST
jgi:hypothetical protein